MLDFKGRFSGTIFLRLLISLVAINILVSSCIIILAYNFNKNAAEKRTKENLEQQLLVIDQRLTKDLTFLEQTLRYHSETSILNSFLEASDHERILIAKSLENEYLNILKKNNTYQSMQYVDSVGNIDVKVTGQRRESSLQNLLDRQIPESHSKGATNLDTLSMLFRRMESTPLLLSSGNMEWFMPPREMEIEGPFLDDQGHTSFLTAVAKLDLDTAAFGGILSIQYGLNDFLAELKDIRFFGENSIWVLGRDGEIILQPDDSVTFNPVADMVSSYAPDVQVVSSSQGIVAYKDISFMRDRPLLRVAFAIPSALLFKDFAPSIRFFGMTLILSILIVSVAAFYLSRFLSTPIASLASAAARLADGDLSTEVDVKARGEVGVLVNTFNDMTAQLRETILARDYSLASLKEEMKRVEELTEARIAAEAADKARSQFIANMSHEVRTPMIGVLGTADLLRRTSLNERQVHLVGIILRSGQSLLSIINDVLDFSKIEAGKFKLERRTFELKSVIDDVVGCFAQSAHNKGLRISHEVAPDLPEFVIGDPVRLGQILSNLVGNAVKFTDRGSVSLRCQHSSSGKMMTLRFEVADTGIGISKDHQQRLFRSFEQADSSLSRSHGGTGLGLTICRDLAGLMGGTVGVESSIGVGSLFWLEIPFEAGDPADAIDGQAFAPFSGGYLYDLDNAGTSSQEEPLSAHILVAEDNTVNREVAENYLACLGCTYEVVSTGNEAVQAFRNGRFDIILMDCQMPGMDGLQATRAIREADGIEDDHRRIPIVALTAHAFEADRQACFTAGMDDYLSKPYSIEELHGVLRHWLEPQPKHQKASSAIANPWSASTPINDRSDLILDPAVLNELRSKGSDNLFTRVADIYLEKAPKLVGTIEASLSDGDIRAIYRAAHDLKTSSGHVGARRLAGMAQELEAQACVGDVVLRKGIIDELRLELDLVQEALKHETLGAA